MAIARISLALEADRLLVLRAALIHTPLLDA
jgi:hypothetical protein